MPLRETFENAMRYIDEIQWFIGEADVIADLKQKLADLSIEANQTSINITATLDVINKTIQLIAKKQRQGNVEQSVSVQVVKALSECASDLYAMTSRVESTAATHTGQDQKTEKKTIHELLPRPDVVSELQAIMSLRKSIEKHHPDFNLDSEVTMEMLSALDETTVLGNQTLIEKLKLYIGDNEDKRSLNDYIRDYFRELDCDVEVKAISISKNSLVMLCTENTKHQFVARVYKDKPDISIPEKFSKYLNADGHEREVNENESYPFYSTQEKARGDLMKGMTTDNMIALTGQLAKMMIDFKAGGYRFIDIKPGNFLVMEDGKIKVGDKKSIQKPEDPSVYKDAGAASKQFEPPEFNDRTAVMMYDSRESFSLGLSLYLALTKDDAHLQRDPKTGLIPFKFDHPVFTKLPDGPVMQKIIAGMTQTNPDNRLSLENVDKILDIHNKDIDDNLKSALINALSDPNPSTRLSYSDLDQIELARLNPDDNLYLQICMMKRDIGPDTNEGKDIISMLNGIKDKDMIEVIAADPGSFRADNIKPQLEDFEKRIGSLPAELKKEVLYKLIALNQDEISRIPSHDGKNAAIYWQNRLNEGKPISEENYSLLEQNEKLRNIIFDILVDKKLVPSGFDLNATIEALSKIDGDLLQTHRQTILACLQNNIYTLDSLASFREDPGNLKECLNKGRAVYNAMNFLDKCNAPLIQALHEHSNKTSIIETMNLYGLEQDDLRQKVPHAIINLLMEKAKIAVESQHGGKYKKDYGNAAAIFAALLSKNVQKQMSEEQKKELCVFLQKHHIFTRSNHLGADLKPLLKEMGINAHTFSQFFKRKAHDVITKTKKEKTDEQSCERPRSLKN